MTDLTAIANGVLDTIKGNNKNIQTAAEFLNQAHKVDVIRDDVGALLYATVEISDKNPDVYVNAIHGMISVSQDGEREQLSYNDEDDVIGLLSFLEFYY